MPMFTVVWKIDIEADDAHAAAVEALRIQRKADSIATTFEVTDQITTEMETFDLDAGEET